MSSSDQYKAQVGNPAKPYCSNCHRARRRVGKLMLCGSCDAPAIVTMGNNRKL